MSSEQSQNQAKPSSAPEQATAGDSCTKEPSQAPTVSSFPGGSGLARGIYSCTLGRSKTCENKDTTHAPTLEKCDSEPAVEEKCTEETPDKEEHAELKGADPGTGFCCMKPDSKKN